MGLASSVAVGLWAAHSLIAVIDGISDSSINGTDAFKPSIWVAISANATHAINAQYTTYVKHASYAKLASMRTNISRSVVQSLSTAISKLTNARLVLSVASLTARHGLTTTAIFNITSNYPGLSSSTLTILVQSTVADDKLSH
jgi:hypothetical protein